MTHDGPRGHHPDRVGNVEVNGFQRLSGVMAQKSLPKGSGLVVSEAMRKGAPVVASRLGGIPAPDGRRHRRAACRHVKEARGTITRLADERDQAELGSGGWMTRNALPAAVADHPRQGVATSLLHGHSADPREGRLACLYRGAVSVFS